MNTLEILKMSNGDESWDFLNCDIQIERNLEDSSEESFEVVELTDAVYYANEKKMKQKQWSFTARVTNKNDYKFKRFLNKNNATFTIDIIVNGINYELKAVLANQVSEIDYGVVKDYKFALNISSRALKYERVVQNSVENPNDKYNVGLYNVAKYSSNQVVGNFQFNFENNADTNCYFKIKGNGVGSGVKFYINNSKIEFNIPSLLITDTFEYSNIPLNLELKINGIRRIDAINLSTNTFTTETISGINNILIEGLKDVEVDIVKGYKII